jgi:hypothetical protein
MKNKLNTMIKNLNKKLAKIVKGLKAKLKPKKAAKAKQAKKK